MEKQNSNSEKDVKLPAIYLHGKCYYFKINDGNKRKSISTGCADEASAKEFVKTYIQSLNQTAHLEASVSIADILRPFAQVDTNPKKQLAEATGSCYGVCHAKTVARDINYMADFMIANFRSLFYCNVKKVTRKDIYNVFSKLLEKDGRTYKTRSTIKSFKTALSWAYSIGDLNIDLTSKIPNIKVDVVNNKVKNILPEDINYILTHEELYYSQEAQDFITLAITTGMRRAEIAAIQKDQISYDVNRTMILNINRAYKDSWTEAGLPKWNLTRVIPLSKTAEKAIARRLEQNSNKLFEHINSRKIQIWFKYLKAQLELHQAELSDSSFVADLSPHTFRHSLNTNLRVTGLADILVAEYMSWEHQSDIEVQQIYTHIVPRHLLQIASKIDELYMPSNAKLVPIKRSI